jgi:dihydroorotate dehydrogenase
MRNPIEVVGRLGMDVVHQQVLHRYLTRGEAKKDREIAHERALKLMEEIQKSPVLLSALHHLFTNNDPILSTTFAGIDLPNPVGVAAGFDKKALVHRLLGHGLGFGHVTVGSVTYVPYGGNLRERVFDLPTNEGLINRMGFPGDGGDAAEAVLAQDEQIDRLYALFISIAASKPSFERGTVIEDYVAIALQLMLYGDAHEVNVSSPNTPGVRGLQEPEVFRDLAQALASVYTQKPLFYKFSPDLEKSKLIEDIQIALDNGAKGITLTNTTTDPEIRAALKPDIHREEAGGISGNPVRAKSLQVSHSVHQHFGDQVEIKRAGGISSGREVWQALTWGGASIVELLTALVRQSTSTPNLAHHLTSDLAKAMRKEGMTSMRDFAQLQGKWSEYPNGGNKRMY